MAETHEWLKPPPFWTTRSGQPIRKSTRPKGIRGARPNLDPRGLGGLHMEDPHTWFSDFCRVWNCLNQTFRLWSRAFFLKKFPIFFKMYIFVIFGHNSKSKLWGWTTFSSSAENLDIDHRSPKASHFLKILFFFFSAVFPNQNLTRNDCIFSDALFFSPALGFQLFPGSRAPWGLKPNFQSDLGSNHLIRIMGLRKFSNQIFWSQIGLKNQIRIVSIFWSEMMFIEWILLNLVQDFLRVSFNLWGINSRKRWGYPPNRDRPDRALGK